MELAGKVAIVTGAASGIGRGLAARFVREGATVIASDLPGDAGEAAARDMGARFVAADVSREGDIAALVADALAREGRIDLFVSNAGVAALTADPIADEGAWRTMIDVNLMSHVWAARHVLPHMLARGDGYLLNTASAAGLLTELLSAGYAATKHAALGFAEWLAIAYGPRGIRVSVLCPEGVRTPMIEPAPYIQPTAIDVDVLVDATVAALRDERFLITTHPSTLESFRFKAADHDAWVAALAARRGAMLGDMA